jgi:hypothetical protein
VVVVAVGVVEGGAGGGGGGCGSCSLVVFAVWRYVYVESVKPNIPQILRI